MTDASWRTKVQLMWRSATLEQQCETCERPGHWTLTPERGSGEGVHCYSCVQSMRLRCVCGDPAWPLSDLALCTKCHHSENQ